MNITLEKLSGSRAKITIEVEADLVSKAKISTVKSLSSRMKIPGFRPGHAPEAVLVNQMGEKAFIDEVVDQVVQVTYPFALKEKEIRVVARPEKVDLVSFEPFKYEVTIAVYPEVEIEKYDKLKIEQKKVVITEKELKESIDGILKTHTVYNSVDRVAKEGDQLSIDFAGFDEAGEAIENTDAKNQTVIIGAKNFIPGFEEELVGLKKDEEKKFRITFPADYHVPKMASKIVDFQIKVHDVREPIAPKLDDAFLKTLPEPKTKEEFTNDLRESLTKYKSDEERSKAEQKVAEELLKLGKVTPPEALIDEEVQAIINDLSEDLKSRGVPLEAYLAQQKQTLEQLRKDYRKPATDRVKTRFIFMEIIQREKLQPTNEEIEAEIAKVVSHYGEKYKARVLEIYKKGSSGYENLINRVEIQKLFTFFITTAE